MGLIATQWLAALRKLLPRGPIWRFPIGGVLEAVLLAISDSLVSMQTDAETILTESDPRTTAQLLPEWNTFCGLPDGCIPGGGSTSQQRAAIVGRLNEVGGGPRNKAFYIAVAAAYGFTITIDEPAVFTWRVTSSLSGSLTNMTCDGTCDDPLETFGTSQLECLLNRIKPAHTVLEFAYTG
jgi:uncharacterized protein YmfQ (DUF2313 family)